MFNVAVLKMKDIIKYFMGITLTILVMICVTKYFNKDTDEKRILQEAKNRIKILSENSMLECFDKTLPSSAIINEEYNNIASEDDKIEENKLLQEVLKTQISSIRGLEEVEEKQKQEIEVATQEEITQQTEEQVQVTRNRTFYTGNY